MNIFDFLANPGLVVGTLVGIGIAVLLHWFFPTRDLVVLQALFIVACAGIGLVLEYRK